ncbi:MAG: repeat-containing protein, partial [Pedosphaera sp.]|nr:repeat-containing protein [Pedosphaera sp.]
MKQADEAFNTAVSSSPVRSPVRLNYAQFKIQTGDSAAGRKILEDAVQKAPDFLPALLVLAGISSGEKKYDQAEVYLGRVLASDPENLEGLFLKGRLALAQDKPVGAVAEFERLTRAYPKLPQGFYQLALACNAAKDSSRAITSLNQALALNPEFIEASLMLAQIKVAKGDFNSASVLLRQLVRQQPQLVPARILLAEACRGQGNWEEALKTYQQLEEAYPTNALTPFLLGSLLMEQHRGQEARAEFHKSLELEPNNLNSIEKLTDLDLGEHRYSTAMERVQNLVQKDPKSPRPSLLLAKIHLAQGDMKQAAEVLRKATEANPDFIEGYLLLGNAYNAANQPRQALEAAQHLLAKHPDQPGGLMLLAETQDRLKNYDAARDAYEKVLIASPANSDAMNNLAVLYSGRGQLPKAFDLARHAKELNPNNPFIADTLGWICYKRRDYDQADSLLQESASKLSSLPDVQLHLGLTRYMMGDEAAARTSLQYAAQSKDDFPDKEEANRCLTILAVDPKTAGADARAILEKRVASQPGDAEAWNRLAEIYQREGSADKAIAAYEARLKVFPKDVRALMELTRLYSVRPDQTQKALSLAKAAYNLAPDDAEVSRIYGRLAFISGDYKFSLNLLQESARKLPHNLELMFDVAQSAYSVGRVQEAMVGMQNALRADPGFSRAAEARRFLDFAPLAENPAAATAAAASVEQTLKLDPAYVPGLMALGASQKQKSDFAAAKNTYEKVLSRFPDFIPAKKHLAIAYAQEPGNDNRALELALKARDAYPDDPELSKAMGIITCRQG